MITSATIQSIYPVSCALLADMPGTENLLFEASALPELLREDPQIRLKYPYLADLARVEWARHTLLNQPASPLARITELTVNPALELLPVSWNHLVECFDDSKIIPQQEDGFVLVWKKADAGIKMKSATNQDLLALKIVSEEISTHEAAESGKVSIGTIDDVLYRATSRGLLLAPPSLIVRSPEFPRGSISAEKYLVSPVFTLQWHVTQVCDLHCRHCYDRSDRSPLQLDDAVRILDDLYEFCQQHHVYGQVSFTGGNPLLYPHFNEVYRQAAERGFLTAILGNPMPAHRIDELLAIQKPGFYQVSLEGLQEHNDYIRGKGHFERVFEFLDLLRNRDIYSMVMLTLTRANMDQVLDLAELLRGRTDLFTFNRLSLVGEGADLVSAPIENYPAFLRSYLKAAENNPVIARKDSLLNIVLEEDGKPVFGGCAGYGCGAAFNFVSLLPDGEVHACRKFPSPMGNIFKQNLAQIYHSESARRYRAGSQACNDCSIRPVCGGCMAVSYGMGKDIFTERDPYCFKEVS